MPWLGCIVFESERRGKQGGRRNSGLGTVLGVNEQYGQLIGHFDNDGISLDRVQAVLVGHSHYDHLADVPVVLLEHARTASVLVNRSGANMLSAFPSLGQSVVALEPLDGRWLRLSDRRSVPLPVRVLPLRSGHADHRSV